MDPRGPACNRGHRRIGFIRANQFNILEIHRKSNRMKIQGTDADRVALETAVHPLLDISAERLIHEGRGDNDRYHHETTSQSELYPALRHVFQSNKAIEPAGARERSSQHTPPATWLSIVQAIPPSQWSAVTRSIGVAGLSKLCPVLFEESTVGRVKDGASMLRDVAFSLRNGLLKVPH